MHTGADVRDDAFSWPFFDAGHRAEAQALERWAADALPALVSERDEDPQAVDACVARLVRALGAAGMLRACVPEAYGGLRPKLEVRSLCIARETLARASGLADFALAMQGLGSAPISLFGTEEQKRTILPAIASGERIGAFALSEPDAGSDAAAIATTATRDGDGWRLDGVKTWISNAGIATQYVVFARTGEAPGTKGVSAFIVEADLPGIAVEPIRVIAPHPLGTVRFSNCPVPADAMLGAPGQGFRIAMGTLDVFRSTVGAAALGFARRALDEATRRARERTMFGRTLADMQLTQAKLGDMALGIDAAALLVARAGWTRDVADRADHARSVDGEALRYGNRAAGHRCSRAGLRRPRRRARDRGRAPVSRDPRIAHLRGRHRGAEARDRRQRPRRRRGRASASRIGQRRSRPSGQLTRRPAAARPMPRPTSPAGRLTRIKAACR